MPRTIVEVEDTQVILGDGNIGEAMQAVNALAVIDHETNNNARAIAAQLSYSGTLSVGALEDEIRFYQSRSVEACLELGKRLLILKEMTPHGEFTKRTELLGIHDRMARRFMSATMKFSKTDKKSVLNAAGNQSKLLELLVLDDSEIDALENGDSVRGISLDDIDIMSASELKKALIKSRKDAQSKDAVILKKDEKLNELDQELERQKLDRPVFAHTDWPEAFKGYLSQVDITRKNLKHAIGSLDVLRIDAMMIEPQSEQEEASLTQAKAILATELVGIHNDCLDMIEALGLSFDKTLGAYSEARIRLLQL